MNKTKDSTVLLNPTSKLVELEIEGYDFSKSQEHFNEVRNIIGKLKVKGCQSFDISYLIEGFKECAKEDARANLAELGLSDRYIER